MSEQNKDDGIDIGDVIGNVCDIAGDVVGAIANNACHIGDAACGALTVVGELLSAIGDIL